MDMILNKAQLTEVISHIDNEMAKTTIHQPILIAGERGSGKSTLLNEIIRTYSNDKIKFIKIDGRLVFNSTYIIEYIESVNCCSAENQSNNDMSSSIIVIDDMDFYFERSQYDDQYLLRNYLNSPKSPLLIASVSSIQKAITDYNAPFFEGFKTIYLPEFNIDYLNSLSLSPYKRQRVEIIMKYLPRVAHSLSTALEIVNSSDKSDTDINRLIDMYSSSYREKLEKLPVNSQKIIMCLAQSDGPMTLTDISQQTMTPGGILSTYIRQMIKNNIIRKTEKPKRRTPYEISDPLFKLWLSNGWNR